MNADTPIISLANRLAKKLADPNLVNLPSIAVLAIEFRVSNTMMSKAVHILAARGLIECRKGAGICRPGGRVRRRQAESPVVALVAELRSQIADGTYVSGEALPKIRFFTLDGKHSATTVVRTLKTLLDEGLVHKQGKRWIAGRAFPKQQPSSTLASEGPVALLVVLNEDYWATMFRHSFTSAFVAALSGELVKHRISLRIASIHSPHNELNVLPTGEVEIDKFIRCLGNRYQGSLVTFFPDDILAEWVTHLARFGKPVVNFNSTNELTAVSRTSLALRNGTYFNVHLDDSSAVRLALGHLADCGHRVIGVPMLTTPGFEWMLRRVALVKKFAERDFPHMRIITVEQMEPWWSGTTGFSVDDFTTMFNNIVDKSGRTATLPQPAGLRSALLKATPSLTSLVQINELTALLALNNDLARKYYCWLRHVGIDVPEKISLISFDNTPESVTFPITTVDFGFARLGYLAAHILIGDIPVKANREGSIPGVCELVDRGSVKRLG